MPNPRAIDSAVVATVKALGFNVFMAKAVDSYLFFTDGTRIGYLENRHGEGLHLTTCHIPNILTGSGFAVGPLQALTRPELESAFRIPEWVYGRDRAASRPWKNWAAFAARHPDLMEI
jgi:hypothetical protein